MAGMKIVRRKIGINMDGDAEQRGLLLSDLKDLYKKSKELNLSIGKCLVDLEAVTEDPDYNVNVIRVTNERIRQKIQRLSFLNSDIYARLAETLSGSRTRKY